MLIRWPTMATFEPRECPGCGITFTPRTGRQRWHSAACRKANQRAQGPDPETKIIRWATVHGAPTRLLIGWDPDTGDWSAGSPIRNLLDDLEAGAPITTTARRHGFWSFNETLMKGGEYAANSEDRTKLPVDIRPIVDLYVAVNGSEAQAETDLVRSTYHKAMKDGRLGLEFLGRRWPNRWREQQTLTVDEADEREAAISALVSDPATAMQLAEMAGKIEDQVEETEHA